MRAPDKHLLSKKESTPHKRVSIERDLRCEVKNKSDKILSCPLSLSPRMKNYPILRTRQRDFLEYLNADEDKQATKMGLETNLK